MSAADRWHIVLLAILLLIAYGMYNNTKQDNDRYRLAACDLIEREAQRCADHLAQLAKDCGEDGE